MAGVNGLQPILPNVTPGVGAPSAGNTRPAKGPGFREALQGFQSPALRPQVGPAGGLKFSNHAIERMQSRGIYFDPAQMEKIDHAVQKAAAKGSKNTLLLTNDSALIVSVKDKTVVTVLDRANMKDNVFTNIDSTVVL